MTIADDDKNIEDDEQDRHIPEVTMKELRIAIDSLNKGTSAAKESKQKILKELTMKQHT